MSRFFELGLTLTSFLIQASLWYTAGYAIGLFMLMVLGILALLATSLIAGVLLVGLTVMLLLLV
jgi:hypothetical protein